MSGILQHRPSKVVKKLLLDKLLGSEVNGNDEWPIFVDMMPDGDDIDDNVLCVINTTGTIHDRLMYSGRYNEDHGIQLMVRATDEEIGYDKSKAICNSMDLDVRRTPVVLDGAHYVVHSVNRTSDVIRLGPEEETSRRRFSLNFLVTLTQSS